MKNQHFCFPPTQKSKEKTDALSLVDVVNGFIAGSDHRQNMFGKFSEIGGKTLFYFGEADFMMKKAIGFGLLCLG